jgi:hypothetical protein
MKNFAILISIFSFLILCCSGSRYLAVDRIKENQEAKLVFDDGSSEVGIINEKSADSILFVSNSNHTSRAISLQEIRRIEKIDNVVFDNLAYPISPAEIDKYKNNRNTWGYAIGGVVIGAAAGIAVSFPLWLAEIDAVPPLFWAGAGAVAGSIFFAIKGQEKDKDIAISKIRRIREAEREIEEQLAKEKEKLQKLETEKQELKRKLQDKQGDSRENSSQ